MLRRYLTAFFLLLSLVVEAHASPGTIAANRRRSAGVALANVYDTRWGTDPTTAAATGWDTFTPHPTNSYIVYDNATQADDSGNGLTPATAKKTLTAALAVFHSNYAAGKQPILLLAGTGGRTYVDVGLNTNNDLTGMGGISAAYPLLIQSYDPADPTNITKRGRLVGADRPRIDESALYGGTTGGSLTTNGNSGTNYYVFQGLEFFTSPLWLSDIQLGFSGLHNGVAVQNCSFQGVRLARPAGDIQNVSKSSFVGAWSTSGNFSNMFTADGNYDIVEDVVLVRGGWRVGASRNDSTTNGGAIGWGHNEYFQAENTHGVRRRMFGADAAADTRNFRGSVDEATRLISLDDPFGAVIGGYSSSWTEAPSGSLLTGMADWVTMGNARIADPYINIGAGFNNGNTQAGTRVSNVALFDAQYTDAGLILVGSHAEDAGQAQQYLTLDNVRTRNYPTGSSISASGTASTSQIHVSITNSIFDATWSDPLLAAYTANRAWGSGGAPAAPTNATRVWVLTQMGFTGATYNELKANALNWMIEYPQLDWYTPMTTLGLQAVGLSPTTYTASTTPPSTAGLPAPRVLFGTSYSGMAWVGGTSFTNGTAASGTITGVPTGWTVWSDNLPTGVTVNSYARTWTWDSSQASPASGSFTLKTGMPSANPYTITVSFTGGVSGPGWDPANSSASYTYASLNTVASHPSGGGDQIVRGNSSHSGTGDWWFDTTVSGSSSTLIGVVNASQGVTGHYVGDSTNSVGYYNSGGIFGNGSGSPPAYASGTTVRTRLENGFLYFATVSGGTATWVVGDPVAQTGGINVSGMGALYPAASSNNTQSFTSDFTNWP